MKEILFLDRITKKIIREKVYGERYLKALYGDSFSAHFFYRFFLPCLTRFSFASKLYGFLQKTSFSKKKIKPFLQTFEMDSSDFLDPVDSFASFNDFFIRKLKPESRPIAAGRDVAILPADARYLVYPSLMDFL